MFKNYLKIAWRTIVKDKYYSLINFIGLTIGLSFFGLMLLTIHHEFNYDSSYSDSDRIYRTVLTTERDAIVDNNAQLPLPFSEIIDTELQEIQAISKAFGVPQQLVQTESSRGRLDNMIATDDSFFRIFDLEFISGEPTTALQNQMSVVLTKETARRFFGNSDPIGKSFEIDRYGLFTVTGVLDKIPENSSFRFSALIHPNIERYLENYSDRQWFIDFYTGWRGRIAHNYVKLQKNAKPDQVAAQIQQLSSSYLNNPEINYSFSLQPIQEVHFNSSGIDSNLEELNGTPGDLKYLYIFIAIAVLILSIACINYMNLASARSIKRTAEVGLRNILGAQKTQLVIQFMTQSVIMAFLSIVPALFLLQFMIPYFESITNIQLALSIHNLIKVGMYALPSVILIGIISGLYPAFVLTRYRLSEVVKQKSSGSVQSTFFRKSLVVGQFTITYSIIVLTLIAGQQINFIFDKELGFEDEQVIVMEINDGRLRNFITDLKTEVSNTKNVVGIAGLTRMFSGYRDPDFIEVILDNNPDKNIPTQFYGFDEDVIPVMDLDVVQGRNFLADDGASLNPSTILINESAANQLFPGESPINKVLTLGTEEQLDATIVGVVKDFHFQSLHEPIEPLIIGYIDNPFVGIDDFAIRLSGNDTQVTIANIEQIIGQFIELDEEIGLEYQFLDSMINQYYATDTVYRKLFTIGAWVTILLSVVGLIGLTSFYAEMRTKEFGIRKVLGASFKDLISIQSYFFLKLIGLAILVGIPIAFISSSRWLQNFSYQVNLDASLFIMGGIITLLIAIIPITIIGLRSSLQNPINQIRTE